MLQRFLTLAQEGGFQSLMEIARALNIPIGMVDQIASDLTKKGYLEEISLDCSAGAQICGGCPIKSRCQNPDRQWTLTEKGRAAVTQGQRDR